jgi:hypothetical protein
VSYSDNEKLNFFLMSCLGWHGSVFRSSSVSVIVVVVVASQNEL